MSTVYFEHHRPLSGEDVSLSLVCFCKSPWEPKLNLLIPSVNKLYLIKDLVESI